MLRVALGKCVISRIVYQPNSIGQPPGTKEGLPTDTKAQYFSSCADFWLISNTLTLIRHGKGGLRAPGRCGRDTCPGERKLDAGYGFGPYAIISPFVS